MSEFVFCVLVVTLGVAAGTSATLRLQVLLFVLGGTAALKLDSLGGATVTVPSLFQLFVWFRALIEVRKNSRALRISSATLMLASAVLWGALLAFIVPRALQGELQVLALSRDGVAGRLSSTPLQPVSGNITQTGYAICAVLTFVSGRYLLSTQERMIVFADAIIAVAFINTGAAALNVLEYYSGMPSLLDFVRTAYATTHQSFAELPRLQGTFPETSSFSGYTIGLFALTFQLWLARYRPARSGMAAALSFLCLVLSTSGTAYAGLAVYFVPLTVSLTMRTIRGQFTPRIAWVVSIALLTLALMHVLMLLNAPIVNALDRFLDDALFNKMESDSGQERGSWNASAWENFLDTYGLGIGIGSVRTSSFVMTLLSNLGVVGTLLYVAFLFQVLTKPLAHEPPQMCVFRSAARHAVLASLGAAVLASSVFDLGSAFYLYAAAASGAIRTTKQGPRGHVQRAGMTERRDTAPLYSLT